MKLDKYLNEGKEHKLVIKLTDEFYKDLKFQVGFQQPNIRVDDIGYLAAIVQYAIKNNLKEITLKSSKERKEELGDDF